MYTGSGNYHKLGKHEITRNDMGRNMSLNNTFNNFYTPQHSRMENKGHSISPILNTLQQHEGSQARNSNFKNTTAVNRSVNLKTSYQLH